MFLEDMLVAISRIAEYTEGSDFDQFKKDNKTVDAVIRNVEIIGEASKNLPEIIKDKYPDVPWEEMYYMRNSSYAISPKDYFMTLHLGYNADELKKHILPTGV